MKVNTYAEAAELLDTFKTTTIKGAYGDTLPVPEVCTETAKRIIEGIFYLGIGLPTSIQQCDGVVLRYDNAFSVDINHDGEIMLFGRLGEVWYDGVDVDNAIDVIDSKVFPC